MWRILAPAGAALQGLRALGCLLLLLLSGGTALAQSSSVGDDVIALAPQTIQAGTAGALHVRVHFPLGYHLNPRAPLLYTVQSSGAGLTIAEADRSGETIAPPLPLVIPFQAAAGTHQGTLHLAMTFYYCREDNTGVCVIQDVRWQVPVHVRPEASNRAVVVSYAAEVPAVGQ